jgi:hypothetical protein
MTRLVVAIVSAAVLAAPAAPSQTVAAADPELEDAKSLYRSAYFPEAIRKLHAVVARIQAERVVQARTLQLADAHLHLGLCYLALDDSDSAKQSFKQVVRLDPQRRLDPQVYAPKVRELFADARSEVEAEPAPAATAPPSSAQKGKTKGRSPLPYVLLGGAAAAGAAVAAGGGGKTPAPAAPSPSPSPPTPVQGSATFVSSSPPSGSTLSAAVPVPVSIQLSVVANQDTSGSFLRVELLSGSSRCFAAEVRGGPLQANRPQVFTVGPFTVDPPLVSCTAPFTTNTVSVRAFAAADASGLTPFVSSLTALTFNFVR